MNNLWKGIAITGIWASVAFAVIFGDADAAVFLMPMLSTIFVILG